MEFCPILPGPRSLVCDGGVSTHEKITIFVRSISPSSRCPQCDQDSGRVHSRYERKLADLPWQGVRLQLCWRIRRFFCGNPNCPQRIFTERQPEIAQAYARRTTRLTKAFAAIGFNCGGEGGARLANCLAMPTSPDTLLRIIRRSALPELPTPRVLGVDDWAFRRGQRYGTVLVDLERRCPVDLLPERSSESFADWLKAHPGVEIVSRDRGDFYIKGATEGSPDATQVADRWHLLKNLREALMREVDRHASQVQAAAQVTMATAKQKPSETADSGSVDLSPSPPVSTRAGQLSERRRQRRLERYNQVVDLHEQGVSIRETARQLGMQRRTVRRFLAAGCFPERAQRQFRRSTDRFEDYLRQRWEEGCHNARQLTSELRQHGFRGSYDMVRRCVEDWRQQSHDGVPQEKTAQRKPSPSRRPSSNRISWMLLKLESDLDSDEKSFVKAIHEQCPTLEKASALAQQFFEMFKQRRVEDLDDWLARAGAADGPAESRRFAKGLQADLSAVEAALKLPWSNGQTEGQVNRLKTIKRQMYGRANFDLLRQRFLHAA
jgi:transposase